MRKFRNSSRILEKRSRLLSLNLKKVTDATTSVTSKSDVVDSQEEGIHDHVFDSHHHHVTHTNLLVCALSTLTGTVVLTTASEPAPEQKVCVFDHEKYIKEVDAKKVQYEADLDKKVIEWTKQIEEWKKSA